MEQPTQFSVTPLSAQGSYGDEYQACSSRVLQLSWNVAESCFGRGAGSGVRILSDYQMFRNFALTVLAQVGIDDWAPFFSRRIQWTPPSFQWHNPVSAWLSLRVRASDYRWCPNIVSSTTIDDVTVPNWVNFAYPRPLYVAIHCRSNGCLQAFGFHRQINKTSSFVQNPTWGTQVLIDLPILAMIKLLQLWCQEPRLQQQFTMQISNKHVVMKTFAWVSRYKKILSAMPKTQPFLSTQNGAAAQ